MARNSLRVPACRVARGGYSVVDLILTLALGGLMVALLLPVIQDSRESARQTFCSNRLANIALDAHMFESIHARLPSCNGASGAVANMDHLDPLSPDFWGIQQFASPLAMSSPARNRFAIDPSFWDFDQPLTGPYYDLNGWTELVQRVSFEYKCPIVSVIRRNNSARDGIYMFAQPVYDNDPDDTAQDNFGVMVDNSGSVRYGETSYVACLGASTGGTNRQGDLYYFRGMISTRETVTLQDVIDHDGLSASIMYGENIGTVLEDMNTGMSYVQHRWGWLTGAAVRGRGWVPWAQDPPVANVPTFAFPNGGDPRAGLLGSSDLAFGLGFASNHRCGVNFAFGDASTHCVSRTTDWALLYAWMGAFDGGRVPGGE